ncbi:MAG: hypothetical protein KDM64_17105, partial [Verrucomicrobiae bacterium]|nr:hypothetical protein [Verrucomicrobiae bacterium]
MQGYLSFSSLEDQSQVLVDSLVEAEAADAARPRKAATEWERTLATLPSFTPPFIEAIRRFRELFLSDEVPMECVWSGLRIRRLPEIDYVMPPRSGGMPHLWNLMPIRVMIHRYQGDRLASDALLWLSRERIIEWWRVAYVESPFRERFFQEVGEGLELPSGRRNGSDATKGWEPELNEVFEGFRRRHAVFRDLHGVEEWGFCGGLSINPPFA